MTILGTFDIISPIAGALGIEPTTVAALIPIIIMIFNVISRAIPDDATGVLGVLRRISSVLGLYLQNRVTRGCSTTDLAKEAAHEARNAVSRASTAYTTAHEARKLAGDAAEVIRDPTKAMVRNGAGKFVSRRAKDEEGLEEGEPR